MQNIKELFFENTTRKHQQLVAKKLIGVAKLLLDRAIKHDNSNFSKDEKPLLIDPVYKLNNDCIEYGSDEYKEQLNKMGA